MELRCWFVLVLAIGAVAPAPTCDCKDLNNVKLSEQSCLLNQLLHIISHLVSCTHEPTAVTPEKYQKLLDITKCSEPKDEKPQGITDPPPTVDVLPVTVPSVPKSTSEPFNWLGVVTSGEPSDESPETGIFTRSTPLFPITIYPPYADEVETGESSSEEDTETPAPEPAAAKKPEPKPPATEEPKAVTTSEPEPPATEEPQQTTTSEPETTTHIDLIALPVPVPDPLPLPLPVPFPIPLPITEPPEEPVTEPESQPAADEKTCDENSAREEEDDVEENKLQFQPETFFIPVLKFHGAPCMTGQELKDYLFGCLPPSKNLTSKC
jgi:hypothetical protein